MEKFIKKTLTHPLISGSIFLFFGTTIANVANFLFNLFMIRNLTPVDYGILASVIALISLPGVLSTSIFPTLVNFSARYFAKNKISYVKGLFVQVMRLSLAVGLLMLFFFVVFSQPIGAFFKIKETGLIIMAGIIVFLGFVSVVNVAILQGRLKFTFIALLSLIGSLSKLILGVGAILLGAKVLGVLVALFFSGLASYLTSFTKLIDVLHKQTKRVHVPYSDITSFAAPSALAMFSLTAFITVDIMLVKHFFDPLQAGYYAGLSLIGRIVFFLSAPINTVMFPLVTQKYSKGEAYKNTVYLSFFIVLIPSIFLIVFYYMFPEFVISLFNKAYLPIKDNLVFFAFWMTLYSLVYIMTNAFLSLNKTFIAIPLSIAAISQALLIWFIHSSIFVIIAIDTAIMGILLFVLLVYYFRMDHRSTSNT